MIKVLYLLLGISLKQLVDEIRALSQAHVTHLTSLRDSVATYRPVPALQKGSQAAHSAIAANEHAGQVAPQVQSLTRKILFFRLVPLFIYVLVCAGLLAWICYLESVHPSDDRGI